MGILHLSTLCHLEWHRISKINLSPHNGTLFLFAQIKKLSYSSLISYKNFSSL